MKASIGIFDSGYGGLTVLENIRAMLPEYNYIYLGDNARNPYGTRSFEVVYRYTLECVNRLFEMGCELIILACNTASAKALRNIQQNDLPKIDPNKRVLGVIRPTVEYVGEITKTKHIGIFGTEGTVQSNSYPIELKKTFPDLIVNSQACNLWVPLIENGEHQSEGANYFVKKYCDSLIEKDPLIDTVILACTHYPLLYNKIKQYLPKNITIINQGPIVAASLKDYLKRHADLESRLCKNGTCTYYTTESEEKFSSSASIFLNSHIKATQI